MITIQMFTCLGMAIAFTIVLRLSISETVQRKRVCRLTKAAYLKVLGGHEKTEYETARRRLNSAVAVMVLMAMGFIVFLSAFVTIAFYIATHHLN